MKLPCKDPVSSSVGSNVCFASRGKCGVVRVDSVSEHGDCGLLMACLAQTGMVLTRQTGDPLVMQETQTRGEADLEGREAFRTVTLRSMLRTLEKMYNISNHSLRAMLHK